MLAIMSRKMLATASVIALKGSASFKRSAAASKSCAKLFSTSENQSLTAPLPYKILPFNSCELDAETLPVQDTSEFGTRLYMTIEQCKKDGINSIFLRVPMLYSHYVPVAGLYGFKYHRAESDAAHLLLWLPKDIENNVPVFATHHCGVAGAIVVPDKEGGKILVVKEKNKDTWKLPGGYVNLGEEFPDAAVREVYEETGVRATFESILTVRHSHNIQFGRSDVYVICRLGLGLGLANGVKDIEEQMKIVVDQEIENAKWVALKEFKSSNKHPMLACVADILLSDAPGLGLVESEMLSPVKNRGPFRLYHPKI